MTSKSKIEWTECTWNPVTGCTKVSEGCRHCYAERMARRLRAMGKPNYVHGFALTMHPHMLEEPLTWKHPQMIFVNSMSDLFHESLPVDFIQEVFHVMNRARHHIFQVLTKRSERLLDLSSALPWPENVWMGVTVEHLDYTFRIEHLRDSGARTKFLSLEPLLTPIANLDLAGIDWVIVGGESGPKARPMATDWVRNIRDQCIEANVPFFFKQWGGINKKKAGKELDGRTWTEMPPRICAALSETQDSLF
ncbi:MAG TPA: phage Gp37/Gp68 family protein [Desulfomonilaceae bacterium]|nr:phage Gp37/Gp68 family protein [Desulfomonilaceae bacterium]